MGTPMTPTFSLCHTTARLPKGWIEAAKTWFARCDHPENCEYILAVDEGEEANLKTRDVPWNVKVTFNSGRRCAVDGWNAAAKRATGQVLITVSDDWFPCEHWDTELLNAIGDIGEERVVDVSTGGDDKLLTFSILTRPYFERLTQQYGYQGGFFFPEYGGMYADNDFDAFAKRDGVVVSAKHLYFEHRHPIYEGKTYAQMDAVYQRQQRPEAYHAGLRIFRRRMREFNIGKPIIAFLLPGEMFSQAWVGAWTSIVTTAVERFDVRVHFGHCSNVYLARQAMWDQLRFVAPDYIVWIDDDQVLPIQGFTQLLTDLDERPDLDGVVGWSWCEPSIYATGTAKLSCGHFVKGNSQRMSIEELRAGSEHLKPISYSGFPAVIFRGHVLDRVGERAFYPIFNEAVFPPWGMGGEDASFFFRAGEKGLTFAVDRRVKVPHLKLRCAEPVESSAPGSMELNQALVPAEV
jgi:hypothetical protein